MINEYPVIEIVESNVTTAPRRSFDSLLVDFTAYADISRASMKSYIVGIKRFIAYLHDNGITAPVRQNVIDFRNHLLKSARPNTVQLYITSVKIFFKFLAQFSLYDNIADGIKGAKIDSGFKKDYLSADQARLLLESTQNRRDKAMIALMLSSGLRTVEIARANIGDLRVHGGKTVLYVQGKGKTSKSDFVPVSSKVEKLIRDYLADRGNVTIDDPLFCSDAHRNGGKSLTAMSVSRIVKIALRRAGLKTDRLTAHSLRHTSATLALQAGADFRKVSMLLRHANLKTTLIYSHDLDQASNNSADMVADSFLG